MPPTPSTAEFDAYAAGYAGGMEDPVKQMFGPSLEAFLQRKVNWLLRHVRGQGPLRLLDFGCGTADFLRLLHAGRFRGTLDGFDASAEMIAEARRRWTGGPPPRLLADASGKLPYPDRSFDVIVACCVFHHIMPPERPAAYRELARVLAPGGRLFVFEHNSWNPVTSFIVKRAPIDQNAVLLCSVEAKRGLAAAGLTPERTDYLLFFPLWVPAGERAERLLFAKLPLGGQYVAVGRKGFDVRCGIRC